MTDETTEKESANNAVEDESQTPVSEIKTERGILTQTDTDFLINPDDYEKPQDRSHRKRVAEMRVKEGLKDFQVIVGNWEDDQFRNVIETIESEGGDVEEVATNVIEFLYVALNSWAQSTKLFEEDDDEDPVSRLMTFENALTEGIRRGKSHFGEEPQYVCLDSTTGLQEFPEIDKIMNDLSSERITEIFREVNEHYRTSLQYSDDDVPADPYDAIKEIQLRMGKEISHRLSLRQQAAGSFRRPNVQAQWDAFAD